MVTSKFSLCISYHFYIHVTIHNFIIPFLFLQGDPWWNVKYHNTSSDSSEETESEEELEEKGLTPIPLTSTLLYFIIVKLGKLLITWLFLSFQLMKTWLRTSIRVPRTLTSHLPSLRAPKEDAKLYQRCHSHASINL